MALWSTLGDLMLGSGWPESLKVAGIVNSLAAGIGLLTAVNVMRTRYAHQVTIKEEKPSPTVEHL